MTRARVVRVVLVVVVGVVAWCVVGVGAAVGAPGDLTQKADPNGCIVNDASTDITGCTNTGLALDYAGSVTVSPDGVSVYVVFCISDAVAVFDRAADGTLTQKAGTAGCIVNDASTDITGCDNTGKALYRATSVTVSPDGASVYVASYNSNAVAVFDRAADGILTQKAGTAGCIVNDASTDITGCTNTGLALDGTGSVTVSPDGTSVYVASYSSDAVAVFDRAGDGTLTQKGGTAGCIVDSDETDITGCTNTGLALNGAGSVTVSPDGASAYVASYYSDAVAVFDRASDGTLTQKAGTAGCIVNEPHADITGCTNTGLALYAVREVTVSSNGASVYVASHNSDAVAVFDRASDGTLTQKAGTAGCIVDSDSTDITGCTNTGKALNGANSVTVSPDGASVYVASWNSGAVAVFDREGPFVPGAPSGVVGVSGDGQVALSWVAPASNGGAVITDYVVEHSSDGGASWSTFADGTSTSTSAAVTGLSNGTGYVFRVSAVNSAGTGPVSVVSAEVAPWWPAPAGCTIVGTPGDDVLVGTSGADHICGLGGNDTIYGKSGNDVLDGGPGNDKLFGGTGKDRLYGRGGADVLKGGPSNDKLYGNGGRDKLYGKGGNDRLAGGSGRDKLYGNGGKDKLYGGKARDLLAGGSGKDKLYGGKGKDKAKKPGPDLLVSIEIIVP
jgi:DNA-binding beta-propeller fold protein YncE